jgi:hypothetical protein
MAVTKMTFGGNSNAPTLLGGGNFPVSLSLVGNNGLAYFRRIDDGWLMGTGSGFLAVPSGAVLGFSSVASNFNIPTGVSSMDAFFARSGAAHIKMGALHATTATDQTFSAHNVTNGTAAKLTISGGNAVNTGTGGAVEIKGGKGGTANGQVLIKDIPTVNPGAGYLWNNAGTLEIGT